VFVQTLLQWTSNKYYIFRVFVCSLSYPAWNAHVPYCHLWPVRIYNIFPHFLTKNFLNTKRIWFFLQRMSKKFHILRRTERDVTMYTGFHVKYLLFLSDFNETWTFSTDFRDMLNYQIPWKSFQWKPSCSTRADWRTDRHDEADSRFSWFCERA
jgi:hypothetical protein